MLQTQKQNLLKRSVAFSILLFACLLSAIFTIPTHATPPSTMNFQGRLASSNGVAVADGQYNVVFRIYPTASGGSAVWSETREASSRVTVQNGLFSVQLGEVTPLPSSVFASTNLYFEVQMATPGTANCGTASCATWESPMTPRNKLATSAYSFNASRLNGQSASDFASATGSANYIQNTTTAQTASFNVSGTGRVGGAFTAASTSTFTGAMTVNNTALFRNSTNSATAFRIQNSGGSATLFTGDTTNSVIQIGSSTTDATAVRFVLDSSSSASDPTGINGAMYYSTSRNKMRCYEGNIWKNCDTSKGMPTAQATNYTAKDGDLILGDASAASFTVTLPAATPGATVTVKKITAPNSITVTATGGVQIDNLTSDVLTTQWLSQDYFSDGTKWYRV